MRKITIIMLAAMLTLSCSYMPFTKKKDEPPAKTDQKKAVNTDEVKDPKPGDIRVIDGVEYIYVRNKKYMLTPYERENVWIRKDQYSPGTADSTAATSGNKKEKDATELRTAKLEEESKKKGLQPQTAPSPQTGSSPSGMGFMPGTSLVAFDYPSPKMKRRVIVLPTEDQTNYKNEYLGELATKRLILRLENTGAVVCVDPNTTKIKGSFTDPANMKTLSEVFGVQTVLKSTLSDVYTSTSKIENKDVKEASFAMSKLSIDIYNTGTGLMLKQLSGRNPISFSKEQGDHSSEKAKDKSIDLTIEIIAEDLLKAILSLDWHARIISIREGRVYINAGRLSGLEKGATLEAYAPGEKIVDPKTKAPLGTTKGVFKGELEVVELFGVDASWATAKKGGSFSPTDLVYVKQ